MIVFIDQPYEIYCTEEVADQHVEYLKKYAVSTKKTENGIIINPQKCTLSEYSAFDLLSNVMALTGDEVRFYLGSSREEFVARWPK